MRVLTVAIVFMASLAVSPTARAEDTIKLGLNYPKTGPYFAEGLDELRAATLAVDEINEAGGVLGKQLELVIRDSQAKVPVTKVNVAELIDKEKVAMIFGGGSSAEAVAAAEVCQEKGILYFGTLTYSNDVTGKDAHRHAFRECYNAQMGAAVLAKYLKKNFAGKKYFFVTANYTWGWSTEASIRRIAGAEDEWVHKRALTPFPGARITDFRNALKAAQEAKPDVLVLVEFGQDMVKAVNEAAKMGLKASMQIIVPSVEEHMAEGAGPKNMAGIIGSLPWTWRVPYKYGYTNGIKFVEKFASKFGRYPATTAASAYTIVYEWKAAVERAGSVETPKVIKALEGHAYTSLKDTQVWRALDHQSVQTVYAVRCNPQEVVDRDKYRLDYFEIIDSMSGEEAIQSEKDWKAARSAAGKAPELERLPGE